MGWYGPNRSYVCGIPLSVHELMPGNGPPSRTRTVPVAVSLSLPSLPCEGNEVDSGGEGGRGANFELVVVAGRGQVVVARVALRREVGTREWRKDAGQTKSWLRSPCAYSTSFNLAVVWLLPTVRVFAGAAEEASLGHGERRDVG